MAQELDKPDVWQMDRETTDLIPLVVETYTAASGWAETANYTVTACAAGSFGTRTYVSASTAGGRTGYWVDGPALGRGVFYGFTKINGAVLEPVDPAFILKIT